MKNVTYLFGAGASAEVLPVSGNIKQKFPEFLAELEKKTLEAHGRPIQTGIPWDLLFPWREGGNGHYGEPLSSALVQLQRIADSHPSLDTYARMLFFRDGVADNKELLQFKAVVASYFLLLEMTKPIDLRYEHFLASVPVPPVQHDC